MALGLLLMGASALLLTHNQLEEVQAAETAQVLLTELEQQEPLPPEPPVEALPQPLDTTEVNGRSYLGQLEIPDLQLCLPVLAQWSDANLKLAPCRYSGDLSSGDLVLLAHSYRRHFGQLSSLVPGAAIRFTDVHGTQIPFSVAEIELLQPEQVEEMQAGDYPLTLFTCNYGGRARVTLRCVRSQQSQ